MYSVYHLEHRLAEKNRQCCVSNIKYRKLLKYFPVAMINVLLQGILGLLRLLPKQHDIHTPLFHNMFSVQYVRTNLAFRFPIRLLISYSYLSLVNKFIRFLHVVISCLSSITNCNVRRLVGPTTNSNL